MAAPITTVEELLCIEELERKLTDLTNHVQLQKEIVSGNIQELHSMLVVREHSLLQELDDVVTEARREITEKRKHLQQLYTARESVQRDITSNELREVLKSNLHLLEDNIGEELSREMKVGWVECVWKKEELEECVIDVCKVVILKERPFQSEDYRLKLSPVWSRESPFNDNNPCQMTIDETTHDIFVIDQLGRIVVFDKAGKYLYNVPMGLISVGIVLTNGVIYASSVKRLHKFEKSSNKCIEFIHTQHHICALDIDKDVNIYGCEYSNNSIVVYKENLTFHKRIQLKSSHINSYTNTNSIKLYNNKMYVMFVNNTHFHLQIFSLEGELIISLIPKSDIQLSNFFSIDRLGNIIVTDHEGNKIKIFSNTGELIHTITNDMLPEGKKLCRPNGVVVDRHNRIIVANRKKNCYLIAF